MVLIDLEARKILRKRSGWQGWLMLQKCYIKVLENRCYATCLRRAGAPRGLWSRPYASRGNTSLKSNERE
jgi:hypothetical protein